MFLHIGFERSLRLEEIVAIIGIRARQAESTNEFIEFYDDLGKVIHVSPEQPPKSLILTSDRLYLSPISAGTLWKRIRRNGGINHSGS